MDSRAPFAKAFGFIVGEIGEGFSISSIKLFNLVNGERKIPVYFILLLGNRVMNFVTHVKEESEADLEN